MDISESNYIFFQGSAYSVSPLTFFCRTKFVGEFHWKVHRAKLYKKALFLNFYILLATFFLSMLKNVFPGMTLTSEKITEDLVW